MIVFELLKKYIVIVEIVSTGFNYVEDVIARGYQPVVVEALYPGTEEDRAQFLEGQETARQRLPEGTPCIRANKDYDVILEQVRKYNPIVVVAGSEYGVELATRLGSDLGLPSNPWSIIGKMTRKDEMQQALADYGIRYIRGRVVRSEAEAEAFYKELGTKNTVIKRVRSAATLGLHLCNGLEELMDAVRTELAVSASDEHVGDILMQERIIGKEYIVNTVSCAGKHRLVSMCFYDKLQMNGSNIYNYMETVTRLDVGESAIVRYAYDVLDAIGIQYGPVHGEFMVDEKGPVLIEINCMASMKRTLPSTLTSILSSSSRNAVSHIVRRARVLSNFLSCLMMSRWSRLLSYNWCASCPVTVMVCLDVLGVIRF